VNDNDHLPTVQASTYLYIGCYMTLTVVAWLGVIKRLAPELLFLNLEHPVYKMCIIQEPNTLEL